METRRQTAVSNASGREKGPVCSKRAALVERGQQGGDEVSPEQSHQRSRRSRILEGDPIDDSPRAHERPADGQEKIGQRALRSGAPLDLLLHLRGQQLVWLLLTNTFCWKTKLQKLMS